MGHWSDWLGLEQIRRLPIDRRVEAYSHGIANGRWSVNVVRALEGLTPPPASKRERR